jgi:hypothetical protein
MISRPTTTCWLFAGTLRKRPMNCAGESWTLCWWGTSLTCNHIMKNLLLFMSTPQLICMFAFPSLLFYSVLLLRVRGERVNVSEFLEFVASTSTFWCRAALHCNTLADEHPPARTIPVSFSQFSARDLPGACGSYCSKTGAEMAHDREPKPSPSSSTSTGQGRSAHLNRQMSIM